MKERLTEEQLAARMQTVIEQVAAGNITVAEAEAYAYFKADDSFYQSVETFKTKYLNK